MLQAVQRNVGLLRKCAEGFLTQVAILCLGVVEEADESHGGELPPDSRIAR